MKKYVLPILLLTDILSAESLSVITVDANQNSTSTNVSAIKINKTEIENSISGNGFISSLLDTNANIQVTDASKNSATSGEITPGKISINNAPFYQNNVSIDGVSNSSLIDPVLNGEKDPYDVPGNENEIFLDLDLIDEIYVYDSNISAEHGNFTGGVIQAKTIRAKAKPSFKFSYKHTSDKFTELHVDNPETFKDAHNDNSQPRFEKNFYSMYLTTPVGESDGIVFSYNRKESIIPGAFFGGFKDKKRLNESYFLKNSHYFEDDSVLDLSATYSPYESTHFEEFKKDSDTTIKGGGYSAKANYEKELNFWNMKTNFALRSSENSKESLNYQKQWLRSSTKDWGELKEKGISYSREGGTGSIEKTQKNIDYNLKLYSNSFNTGSFIHKLKTGLDLGYSQGIYNRKESLFIYEESEKNFLIDCNGDTEGCQQNEQFFKKRKVYDKEKTSVDMISTALYLEDVIKYEKLELVPGVRLDYNNYLKNSDISYRFNSSYKPFGDKSTIIYAGMNRYYGKSFLGYKLREARDPYFEEFRDSSGNVVGDWGTSSDKDDDKYVFSDLDTPYTDEKSLGLKQDAFGMRFNIKYIEREAKDKFSRSKGDHKVYTLPDGVTKGYYRPNVFGNNGYSKSEVLSLNIGPTKPISFSTFSLGYKFSTAWNDVKSNSEDYDDLINDEEEDDSDKINKIYYNGKFYDKDAIPIKSNPKNYNLHINLAFKPVEIFGVPTKITLNNIIRHTNDYTNVQQKTDGEKEIIYEDILPDGTKKEYSVKIYDDVKYKKTTTFDMKAAFEFKMRKKHKLLFTTEINNIFDKVQNVTNESKKYKTGRQFWFNLAYKF